MNNIESSELLSNLLMKSRYESNKSQEYMAMGLNVSKNTIYNWEKGTSSPTLKQTLQWFELLQLNPTPYIFTLCNSKVMSDMNNDSNVTEALHTIIDTLSTEECRELLYLLYGSHGSNPKYVLEMITADLHCPMYNRVNVAQTILDNYEIAERRNELVNSDDAIPDIEELRIAVSAGKQAAMSKQNKY